MQLNGAKNKCSSCKIIHILVFFFLCLSLVKNFIIEGYTLLFVFAFIFVANKAHQVTRNYVDDNPQFLLIIHFKGHGHVFDEKLFLRL